MKKETLMVKTEGRILCIYTALSSLSPIPFQNRTRASLAFMHETAPFEDGDVSDELSAPQI
jgi:hypothetical protein